MRQTDYVDRNRQTGRAEETEREKMSEREREGAMGRETEIKTDRAREREGGTGGGESP